MEPRPIKADRGLAVTPAKAGVQGDCDVVRPLDPRFRGDDGGGSASRRLAVAAAFLALASPALADDPAPPRFVDATAASGLKASYEGEWQYMVGGGVAAFDCAGDGRPSVLIAGGEKPAKFFRNISEPGVPRFQEETSGLEFTAVVGAYPIDIDGDGQTDLAVLRVGRIDLMRGLGNCRFENANAAWGFETQDAWWTAFSATWEKGRNWPTLAFGSYVDRTNDQPWGTCTPNLLYRPAPGERRFSAPAKLAPSFCPLSMLFTDWNRSGTPSLRVSNDREYYEGGQEQMWRIAPGEAPRLYTEAEGWKYLRIWGMGIASYDLSGSGYPDYFLTSMADQKLQRLDRPGGGPAYTDIAYPKHVTAHRPFTGGDLRPSTGWHAQFEDVTNSGRVALFVAKGNVSEMKDFASRDPSNLLMQRDDGSFVEMAEKAGLVAFEPARGAALADFTLDGAVDVLVVHRNAPARFWLNKTEAPGHWVAFRPQDDGANRDAIGGWIELRSGGRVQRRELTVGGGHAGGQSTWIHFGLGGARAAEARMIWPDGSAEEWRPVAADARYILRRGQVPAPWAP